MEYQEYQYLIEKAEEQLKRHEGYREKPYRCTAGKLTIGFGRNLSDNGISRKEAEIMLREDVIAVLKDLEIIFTQKGFKSFPFEVQKTLINMRYQLGAGGFRGFKDTIKLCKQRRWKEMAKHMRLSKWYKKDSPNRAEELANIIENINE